jgi:HlyD family secretion protein
VGEVIKIEPQADTISNVTMFPVLVRINNRDGLLKPGMNAEVNIAVGSAQGVLAVPNAALRTERDVASAASVLGIAEDELQRQLEASRNAAQPPQGDTGARQALPDSSAPAAMPSREQMQALFQKQRSGQALTAEEQALMARVRAQMGGGRNGGNRMGGGNGGQDALFGGRYVVFAMRDGKPTAVYVTTGITDLDWSEVKSGLTAQDSVLLLPSASLIQSQQSLQERMSRNTGLPGQTPR